MATIGTVQVQQNANVEQQPGDEYNLTPAEYRDLINNLIGYYDTLLVLTEGIGGAARNQVVELGGQQFNRRDVRSLQTQFRNTLKTLPRYFNAAKRARKTRRATARNNGFNIPIVVNEALSEFFAQANLGNAVDPVTKQFTDIPLNQVVRMLVDPEIRISSAAVVTPLFCIYAILNNFQVVIDPRTGELNRQLLRADDRMRQYFAPVFQELIEEDARKGIRTNKRGEAIAPFSPESFRYASFQSIFARSQLKPNPANGDNPNWTDQQRQIMYLLKLNTLDPEVIANTDPQVVQQAQQYQAQLTSEQAAASATLAYYRTVRAEQDKPIRAEKRRQQAAAKRAQQRGQQGGNVQQGIGNPNGMNQGAQGLIQPMAFGQQQGFNIGDQQQAFAQPLLQNIQQGGVAPLPQLQALGGQGLPAFQPIQAEQGLVQQ